jgi:hypothetical protein
MYRVFLERAAERDLKRLSSEIHDRVITASVRWAAIRAPLAVASWSAPKMTGVFAWPTIV